MNPLSDPPEILIIDDIPENIEVVAACLADRYRLKVAASGPDGLELIGATAPDLILLDAMMPGMDGYQVCDRLKSDAATADIPVVFVTARDDPESESRALAAGAVDFIHKPVNPDVLRARVRLHLNLRARERESRAANAALQDANGRLHELNTRLHDLNTHLEQRVEERTRALRDSMVLTEAARKAKHLFIANVNHELRTPMNAILGLSRLLAMQLGDSALKERVHRIGTATGQLLTAVDNIIAIADLQAGKVELERVDFGLASLVDGIVETWRGRCAAKDLALSRAIDPGLPGSLRGDRVRLERILDNLVGNAVKFSERGTIDVRVRLAGVEGASWSVCFEVEDEGIGIAEEYRASLFKVFEQGDNSAARKHGGCGLGLAICKQLSELMGGRIGVDGKSGSGSLFWFSVPLESVDEMAPDGPAPDVSEPASPGLDPSFDWDDARLVLVALTGMLAADDIGAYMLWTREKALLVSLLGDRAEAFDAAMESFEFKAAARELRALRARHPQL